MKFKLYKASKTYEDEGTEIEINSLEDLKELQEIMQENYHQEQERPEFSRCELIVNFAIMREEKMPTITVYDYFIE